jgi:acetyl esterase
MSEVAPPAANTASEDAFTLDPSVFDPASVAPDARAFLEMFEKAMAGVPTAVNTPIPTLRAARASGSAALPIVRLETGTTQEISGPVGPMSLRTFRPAQARGAFLHFHGGGFVMGAPDQQDVMLNRLAEETGLTAVSAGYRLAPEHPFPAALDDCLASAIWFLDQAASGAYGDGPLSIGGESAGAYLAVTTLLKLREAGLAGRFGAAVLTYGAYDLSLTPSARNWGERYALISTPILKAYLGAFAAGESDLTSPAVSPLYADLSGLPRALFTVGTLDPLLDDSLFMAQRWRAAGNSAELAVYAGGIHAFNAFPIEIGRQATRRQIAFLRGDGSPARDS